MPNQWLSLLCFSSFLRAVNRENCSGDRVNHRAKRKNMLKLSRLWGAMIRCESDYSKLLVQWMSRGKAVNLSLGADTSACLLATIYKKILPHSLFLMAQWFLWSICSGSCCVLLLLLLLLQTSPTYLPWNFVVFFNYLYYLFSRFVNLVLGQQLIVSGPLYVRYRFIWFSGKRRSVLAQASM